MTETTVIALLDRINLAMARIEAAAVARRQIPGVPDSDSRYLALRTRTQAALASLESVIAQIGTNERTN
ncbi:hypothetical protein [Sphingomonas sp.]|uniref:hypothetical protein n=1 Tax=Sphingomonas sp. TaxID=28214 RepID=UPI0025F58AE9|nr:hypothetical protein [Sphingomonas sp.]